VTGFTELVKLGMSFAVVGDAIVTSIDATDQIVEGNKAGAVVVVAMALSPAVVEKMAAFCKRLGKRWIAKLSDQELFALFPEVAGILSQIPKNATIQQKMAILRPKLEAGEIDREFLEHLIAGGYLRPSNPYQILEKALGKSPKPRNKFRAHHDYPLTKELDFLLAGIDINAGKSSGRWLPVDFHARIHNAPGWPTSGSGGP
jgi:hypothetical protein